MAKSGNVTFGTLSTAQAAVALSAVFTDWLRSLYKEHFPKRSNNNMKPRILIIVSSEKMA
jgi:hypothetical protein